MGFSCRRANECLYKKELDELKEELALVRFELEDLKAKRYKPKNKPPQDSLPLKPPKKKGGLFGHMGWFRQKPTKIDRIEKVRLNSCPLCGGRDLTECKGIHRHIQQDIVFPQLKTTLFKKHLYYCRGCKRVIAAKGDDELPQSYIGPVAKSFALFLKHGVKISDRDITNLFDKIFNLKIKSSSVAGFRAQLKNQAQHIYDKLLQSLRESSFLHIDETGWNISGKNHWLWKFSNKRISLTHIDKSRGQKVLEDILGKDYEGTIISDFLSAYNTIKAKQKQRCLIHLLRDLKKVIRYFYDDKEVLRYTRKLKRLLEKAVELHKDYQGRRWDNIYYHRRELITQTLLDFRFPNPNKRILNRFVKRLNRHKDELFCFLYHKDIDFHNNHAEQQIRPDVIFRKITFQNRSQEGAQNHQVIMSILQTAKLNNLDPIKTLRQILLRKNPLADIVSSIERAPPQLKYAG